MEIKQEKRSFSDVEESDSEPENITNALLSKIKVEPTESIVVGENDECNSEDEANTFREMQKYVESNDASIDAIIKQSSIPGAMELQLKQYLKQFPRIKPVPAPSSFVDIDLANPDEDTWIIQCPANVDIHSELLNKKLNLSASRSKIKNCSIPLEACVTTNSSERPVGLMCGTRLKSFIPTGFVRINKALPACTFSPELLSASETNHVQVPFPENIRQRHPLLGYDFEGAMAVSNKVKKRLSVACKQAGLFYARTSNSTVKLSKSSSLQCEPTVSKKVEPRTKKATETGSSKKSNKRKQAPLEEKAEIHPTHTAKSEEASPKSQLNNGAMLSAIKKELPEEDDISWLLNI